MNAKDDLLSEYQAHVEEAMQRAAKLVAETPTPPEGDEDDNLAATATYRMADLCLWQYTVPDTSNASLPTATSYPNPLLLDDLVIACICSSGQVCALDKETGEVRWHIPLSYLGHDLYETEGYLFGGTTQELLSIDPTNGQIRWTFQPYRRKDEHIYSSPVSTQKRVYIGDRQGMFYCLSADSGQPLWTALTSKARNRAVNATALLYQDRVITATNARLVLAYDQISGKVIWRQILPECSGYQVRFYAGMVLVQTNSTLFGLSPQTGEIVHQWAWEGHTIRSVCVAEDILCVVIEKLVLREKATKRYRVPSGWDELLGLYQDTERWRLSYPRYAGGALRWDPLTRLLYEATYHDLGVVNPAKGERVATIQGFEDEELSDYLTGLPSVEAGTLYVLSNQGRIVRLKHPEV